MFGIYGLLFPLRWRKVSFSIKRHKEKCSRASGACAYFSPANPMKIAVNTRLLLHNRLEGIGWFAFEILKRISAAHPEHEFLFLFDRPFHEEFVFGPNVKPFVLHPQARHPWLFKIWFDFSVARFLRKHKPDLFLSPDGYLSLETSVPQLAVMHDLNFAHRPQDLSRTNARYYLKYFPLFARKAARIATVSQFSKADIVAQYGVEAEKVDVVYNGASDTFLPLSIKEKQAVKDQYTSGANFFFFVGALHPRKNLQTLFPAFDLFKQTTGSTSKLVIVGDAYRWDKTIASAYGQMHFKNDVLLLGRKSQSEVAKLMGSCNALVFVSLFEGFGIPIVEAFRCGTPVITSDVTSMPEVAGGAAMLCSPHDARVLASTLGQLDTDEALRESLSSAGLLRSRDFSWDKTAAALWASIEKAIAESK